MNSFRIGVIGVLVEYGGVAQAEGFLHFFEGWVIFMACTLMLAGEIWLISKLSSDARPWATIFGIDIPAPTPKDAATQRRRLPAPFLVSLVALGVWTVAAHALEGREDVIPARKTFAEFPLSIGDWRGATGRLEAIVLDELKLDDYILADYIAPGRGTVNLYTAYYATQRADQSAHSPRSCLPGGGWVMGDFGQRPLAGVAAGDGDLRVNRVIVQKGDYRQLVYYWFQQRGRNITNEYAVKWYLFADALESKRSDGALIRLTTMIAPTEDVAVGDARLLAFAAAVAPTLPAFIPD
jgi:exosortase D (VPLPA-CTERM-specific)